MSGHRRPEQFVRAELRHVLDSRRPDRTAMLNRIASNRAADSRPRGRFLRLAGSALAVLTVLGVGGVARALADDDGSSLPAAPVPVTTPSGTPSTSAAAGQPPTRQSSTRQPSSSSAPRTSAPASRPPASSASAQTTVVRGHPGDTQAEKGSLWSDGSLDKDGESRVTLRAGAALTELELTIRVARTAGLADTGAVPPPGPVTTSVESANDAIRYHFVLAKGATLPAGTYVFTARYRHDGSTRNAADDTYEAFALSVERKRPHVYGNFLPTK